MLHARGRAARRRPPVRLPELAEAEGAPGEVARYSRSPHDEPVGGPLPDELAIVDEFLRLACLNYGDDDLTGCAGPSDARAARLAGDDDLHTIAATGEAGVGPGAAAAVTVDQASRVGRPLRWEPMLYLSYAARCRLDDGRRRGRSRGCCWRHGADPNVGYLWEGLIPPFTAPTGALGGGGNSLTSCTNSGFSAGGAVRNWRSRSTAAGSANCVAPRPATK